MLEISADAWHKRYMNEEDADETTSLMSGEVVSQAFEADRNSSDRRARRNRENNENTDAVGT